MKEKRIAEYRAELKSLNEQRNEKITEMEGILSAAKAENRPMSDEEQEKFKELESGIEALDATIDAEERARKFDRKPEQRAEENNNRGQQDNISVEVRAAFTKYLRGQGELPSETRADAQSTENNANIIPSEFSRDIIKKVVELSGIFSEITRVNSKGTYKQIIANKLVSAGWTKELAEVMKSAATFDIVDIGHKKLGALVLLSKEIINQAEFDIIGEVTTQMIADFALKAEEGVIKGDGDGMPLGLMSGGTALELAAENAITSDELVKIYHALKAPFLPKAKWVVSRKTLERIRLLKDANGQYLFNMGEITDGFVGTILGKPVLISECMDDNKILFGDFRRAFKANVNPGMEIQRLNEKYADVGAVGILGHFWFDGRPVNDEAYVRAEYGTTDPDDLDD
ncbi:MAG: phage major capsid protein [Defluviitaleaceae bacterium]|nr:phage major capsid protein [Defluviitaleaceae bacterium]MCL2263782.1 phage major capsid protein [Defluviitaleaceae bacterium]